jgi:hypothetical protein
LFCRDNKLWGARWPAAAFIRLVRTARAKGLRNRIAGICISRLSPNVRFWA